MFHPSQTFGVLHVHLFRYTHTYMHMYIYLVLVYKYNSTFMGMYLCVFTFTNICCQHMYMYINGQLTGKDTGLMACWALNEQAVSLPVSLVK